MCWREQTSTEDFYILLIGYVSGHLISLLQLPVPFTNGITYKKLNYNKSFTFCVCALSFFLWGCMCCCYTVDSIVNPYSYE